MKIGECEDCDRLSKNCELEHLSVCEECGHLWDIRDDECSCSRSD